ncbi:MMPL family transporter [Streptosporangium carneum]|uniref:Membrane protein n=1 Tax=Streptosporangium carneum TaxID=47481 RepID=A0A9W6MD80_9ACTN|nr:MMPL family transporter [Streptosporangium carneum]GLK09523.1 membrane protein [Streptosporangium carneum]
MRFLTGRRSKWAVLLVWAALAMSVASLARHANDVTDNNIAEFTPAAADSSKVRELLAKETSGQDMPAVVVYVRDSGITPADRARAEHDLPGVRPIPSADGRALLAVQPVNGADDGTAYDTLTAIRQRVGKDVPDGLKVAVTGPAAFYVDGADAFLDADLTLLLVTLAAVAVFLLLIYRSPVLWLLPLLAACLATGVSQGLVYLLVQGTGLVVTGMGLGILTALVFGAGTDYALLLIARYREELRAQGDRHLAMATALRATLPVLAASAATVLLGVCCLLVADMRSSASLAPVAAVGVVCAFAAMTTLLPALLLVFGRWIFWPLVPRIGSVAREGLWSRAGTLVSRRPRAVWAVTVLGLTALCAGLAGARIGIPGTEAYTSPPESIVGQRLLSDHFPGGMSAPIEVIAESGHAARIARTPGVARIVSATPYGDRTRFRVAPTDPPESERAEQTVLRLREIPGALVGGQSAQQLDTALAQQRDLRLVVPLALAVILVVLVLLLRSILAPLLLVATVVLSFGTALGAGWLIFDRILGLPALGFDAILLGFVFLVALGVDYNIFLVHRVREEVSRTGDHRRGVLSGLAHTGPVITGAGLVLAATFTALTVLPLVWAVEFGLIVAVGVLIDTFLVRSVLVPALLLDIGERVWWPSRPGGERARPRPARTLVR